MLKVSHWLGSRVSQQLVEISHYACPLITSRYVVDLVEPLKRLPLLSLEGDAKNFFAASVIGLAKVFELVFKLVIIDSNIVKVRLS